MEAKFRTFRPLGKIRGGVDDIFESIIFSCEIQDPTTVILLTWRRSAALAD